MFESSKLVAQLFVIFNCSADTAAAIDSSKTDVCSSIISAAYTCVTTSRYLHLHFEHSHGKSYFCMEMLQFGQWLWLSWHSSCF